MLHHMRLKPPSQDYPADAWNIVEKHLRPEFLAQSETMFSLGNGYLGMRGCPEEGEPTSENSTLINGFYETEPIIYPETAYGFAKNAQTIVPLADSKIVRLFVDDEPFDVSTADLIAYERRLNMKAGTLDREILWESKTGKRILVKSKRLVSFAERHAGALSYSVTVLNAAAAVILSSETQVRAIVASSSSDPRKTRDPSDRTLLPLASYSRERRIGLCHGTQNSGFRVVCLTDTLLDTKCEHTCHVKHDGNSGHVTFTVGAEQGKEIRLTKFMIYHTAQGVAPDELFRRAEWTMDRVSKQGFRHLLASQQHYLDDFWKHSDVRVSDVRRDRAKRSTVETQQAIRFSLFHILQASARAEDTGIPAKGLTGRAYEGHYFWDTEIYLLPFLIYTNPRIARNLLAFRYKTLPQARLRAAELSHRGATFPWRTINGEEASAYYAAGTAQYHINADIMYALKKYVRATGDDQFLWNFGAEMLVETARFWLCLGFYSDARNGKFCINAVTGPDEYNTVVNNNAYTNLMARENLRYAAETIASMRATAFEAYEALVRKTGLEDGESEAWTRAADNMYVPYDRKLGIVPQDDSFLDREPWDFENTPADHYPLLLFYHPLNIYRKRIIKQADVVLAMFLLGDTFSAMEKKRNFEFYDPWTTGDSSLSSSVEAIIAAEIGDTDKAIRYGMPALLMDLADVGGNVTDGCHIASMGGSWMMLAYGLGGMRDDDGTLSFRPRRAPEDNAILEFPVTYRGRMLGVKVGVREVEYVLRQGDALAFRHHTEEIRLTRECPIAVRPVGGSTKKSCRRLAGWEARKMAQFTS
jgi:alpha,alpha-trehalose phosphorylase